MPADNQNKIFGKDMVELYAAEVSLSNTEDKQIRLYGADETEAVLEKLQEEIKRLNELLKKYGNHKINCQCAIQMLIAESFECTCGFKEIMKEK